MRLRFALLLYLLFGVLSMCRGDSLSHFPWSSDWQWEQLNALPFQSESSVSNLELLQKQLPLNLAHPLFLYLDQLHNLEDIRTIPDWAAIDRPTVQTQNIYRILSVLKNEAPRNTPDDLIRVALVLTRLRRECSNWFMPDLNNSPFPTTIQDFPNTGGLKITYDFKSALDLLAAFQQQHPPDSVWRNLAENLTYRRFVKHQGPLELQTKQLEAWWSRAANSNPGNRLYEWLYPESYYDYGGVAVQANAYLDLIKTLQSHTNELSEAIEQKTSPYLPTGYVMPVTVDFLFGADVDGWATENGVGMNMDHFGDDYTRIEAVIAHECFHHAQNLFCIVNGTLSPNKDDEMYYSRLLSEVWREGCASYVGNEWKTLPSQIQLQSDFSRFQKITNTLYAQHNLPLYRDQVKEGLILAGSLYRLGWEMARVIDQTQGRHGLIASLILGPGYFFKTYVSCAQKANLPKWETFPPEIVKRINRIQMGVNPQTLIEMAHLLWPPVTQETLRAANRYFIAKEGDRKAGLAFVLLGDRLARANQGLPLAGRMIALGIQYLGDAANNLIRNEGELMIYRHQNASALLIFQEGVKISPEDASRYFMLGSCFRSMGRIAKAKEMYQKALELNPSYSPAQSALEKLP